MQQQQIPHTMTNIATATVTDRFPPSFTPSMPTRSKEAEKRRKEEEAMARTMLEREKEAAAQQLQEEAVKATAAAVMMRPMVVSPPPTSNLNILLTGHVGQDTNGTKEDGTALTALDDEVSGENRKPLKQKKIRKSKLNKEEKDDVATKKGQRRLALSRAAPPSLFLLSAPRRHQRTSMNKCFTRRVWSSRGRINMVHTSNRLGASSRIFSSWIHLRFCMPWSRRTQQSQLKKRVFEQ
jgi:hypothetical protein